MKSEINEIERNKGKKFKSNLYRCFTRKMYRTKKANPFLLLQKTLNIDRKVQLISNKARLFAVLKIFK